MLGSTTLVLPRRACLCVPPSHGGVGVHVQADELVAAGSKECGGVGSGYEKMESMRSCVLGDRKECGGTGVECNCCGKVVQE